ncbi:plasmid stabilization system [Microbacterium sp. HMWF026]|uniref:type II toxin-antitoxin system RelE/ParE family toxin n=1 Tax=Microbacterium sp. HMWF026 TaxID=2056861 RepID=UPI000D3D8BA7|nr:type II toxin-antitoxin system RelE/ParE family toxin [Microbacterium sp. HMWF026]PTT19180.1 plasmid stabilization system [Microbacterium sp. HMWF026]
MTARVVSSRAADDDLFGIIDYYRQAADAETAERFVDAVEAGIRRIADFPSAGSSSAEVRTGIPGLRSMTLDRFPYHLLYTMDDDAVRIHRVLHVRRDAERSFGD